MASTDVLVHINMNGNEIQNVLAQKLATAPTANVSAGRFYFNTTDNTLYVYNGTTWLNALAQGTTYTDGTGITISGNQISVDFTEVATAAQGAKADTALQSGDDISELNNDAGYITNSALSGYVPTSRKINGKALTADITLSASDVSALPSSTTINDLTTAAQQNALNSGATTTNIGQIATNTSAISTINGKIPSQASSSNQLADKAFVNSSIATSAATFRGTFNSVAELEAYSGEKDDNDYAFVTGTDSDGNTYYDRYKYNGTAWVFEYRLNNSSFTSTQWAAINSGATSTNIGQIATNTTDIANLQATAITASSTNTLTNKTIDADDNTISDLTTSNLKSSAIATSISASGVNTKLATEKAVRDVIQSECVKVYSENNPALTASGGVCTWYITHHLLAANVGVHVYNITTGKEIIVTVDTKNGGLGNAIVTINSTSNIAANTLRVVVFGIYTNSVDHI